MLERKRANSQMAIFNRHGNASPSALIAHTERATQFKQTSCFSPVPSWCLYKFQCCLMTGLFYVPLFLLLLHPFSAYQNNFCASHQDIYSPILWSKR